MENTFGRPVEVEVRDSLEKAMKILKQKMSKEGILQELKRRRFYEKPSVKKKRKTREARKRLRREMKRRVMPARHRLDKPHRVLHRPAGLDIGQPLADLGSAAIDFLDFGALHAAQRH